MEEIKAQEAPMEPAATPEMPATDAPAEAPEGSTSRSRDAIRSVNAFQKSLVFAN